jgi:hypothetical protein
MTENTTATNAADSAKRACDTLLGTLADLGTSWAAYGLKIGKMALEQSAHTLGKTAHALDVIADELAKKAGAPEATDAAAAPKADEVDQDAPAAEAPAA